MIIIFLDTLKQIKKPKVFISLIIFTIILFLGNILFPNFFYKFSQPGDGSKSLWRFIHFQYSFITTIFTLGLVFLATLTTDIQETTFIFTRGVKKRNWVIGKTLAQLIILLVFTFLIIVSWLILNKIYYDNWKMNFGIFGQGFTITGLIVTYLIIAIACVTFINLLKWLNKDWIAASILPIITLVLILPYTFYIHMHIETNDFNKDVSFYIQQNTFIIPSIFYGSLFTVSFAILLIGINRMKIKI